jgi:hypothetical protein
LAKSEKQDQVFSRVSATRFSIFLKAPHLVYRKKTKQKFVDCKTKFRHRQKLEIARLSSDGLSLTLAHNHKLNSIIIKNDVVYAYSSNLASIENTPI